MDWWYNQIKLYCISNGHAAIWNVTRFQLLRHTLLCLTHWGRVTHICVSKLTSIGSDNGLSPGRRQAIIWSNAGILLIRPLGTNFSEFLIEMPTISFKQMRLRLSSAKWWPFCLGLNELKTNRSVPLAPYCGCFAGWRAPLLDPRELVLYCRVNRVANRKLCLSEPNKKLGSGHGRCLLQKYIIDNNNRREEPMHCQQEGVNRLNGGISLLTNGTFTLDYFLFVWEKYCNAKLNMKSTHKW